MPTADILISLSRHEIALISLHFFQDMITPIITMEVMKAAASRRDKSKYTR